LQKFDNNIGFLIKTPFFRKNWRKSPKIAENCQKSPKIAENRQKSPKIAKNHRKLPKIGENRRQLLSQHRPQQRKKQERKIPAWKKC
jgi:hypothetical protein